MDRLFFREERSRHLLPWQSRGQLPADIPSAARPDTALCAAVLGPQPPVRPGVQYGLLRAARAQEAGGHGAVRSVLLSARCHPAVEPALRATGFSSISVRHSGGAPRSLRGAARAHRALRHGFFLGGSEAIRVGAAGWHAVLSSPGTHDRTGLRHARRTDTGAHAVI